MWLDWVILLVVVILYLWFTRNIDELGFSFFPGFFGVATLVGYMVFFRERDYYFAVWACLYGALTSIFVAFLLYEYADLEGLSSCFLVVAILVFIGFLLLEVNAWFPDYTEEIIEKNEKIQIYSMAPSSTVNGTFSLGSGAVNGEFVYLYWYKDKDGGLVQDYVSSSKKTTKIYPLIEDEEPHLKIFLKISQTIDPKTGEVVLEKVIEGPLYYFFLPEGYVIQSFSFVD